jgi:hypothetical protein
MKHSDALNERERAQNYSQEQGCEGHPGHKVDTKCIIFHARLGGLVGFADTRSRDKEGTK